MTAWGRLVEVWILPPGSVLLATTVGLVLVVLGRRRLGLGLVIASTLLLYLCSTPLVADFLLGGLDRHPVFDHESIQVEHLDDRGSRAAIVVLGAGLRRGAKEYASLGLSGELRTVSPMAFERMRYGAWLHRQTALPVLVTGFSAGEMAQGMRQELGVEVEWVESESRSTAENALFSARILCDEGIREVVLVTDYWHMSRAVRSFVWNGLDVKPAPMGFVDAGAAGFLRSLLPRAGNLGATAMVSHEWLGWWAVRKPLEPGCSSDDLAT